MSKVREWLDSYFGEDQELYVFYNFKNLQEMVPVTKSYDGWLYPSPRIFFSTDPTPPDDYFKYVYELDKDSIPDNDITIRIDPDDETGTKFILETNKKIKIKRHVN